jgi:hypothetical protein
VAQGIENIYYLALYRNRLLTLAFLTVRKEKDLLFEAY